MELLRRHIHVALGRGKGKYTLAVAFSGFFSIKMFVHLKLKIYCVLNLILREISEEKREMVFVMLLPCSPGYSKR